MVLSGGRDQSAPGKKTYATWQEGLQIFEAVLANKPFILNAYHSISREQIENYLFKLTYALIADVVREQAEGTGLSEDAHKIYRRFL